MGKHLEQALPSVYTLQCLTGKVDNNQLMRQPVRETRTVHASPCISDGRRKSSSKTIFSPFFSSCCQPGGEHDVVLLLALRTSRLQHVSIRAMYTTLSGKNVS